ncbi:MAG: 30S ribosomal protein S1 [Saprospirales bacterium]|nr:30S ribosomal protein S1 [Saprospirales bacterium]
MLEEKNTENVEETAEETAETSATEESTEKVEETKEETPEETKEEASEETKEETSEDTPEEPTAEAEEEVAEAEEAEEEEEEETGSDDDDDDAPAREEEEIEREDVSLEELVQQDTNFDDFDWEVSDKYGITYSEKEREELLKQYDDTLTALKENEIVKGRVTAINDGDVLLDVNFKSDGLVSLGDFKDMPDLKVGDEVEVYVEKQEDERGQLVLSRRKAKLLRAWEAIRDSYENGTVIKGTIIHKTKGGLIVDCGGLETFLPGSQIDIKPIIDYDQFVGKTMEFKVVKINEQIKNAVVSHKALIESDLAEQREAIIASLEKGQVLEGLVKNITDFGAFLDLGGVDGLLYITDISWGRINHPSEVLQLNQKINVVVLDFDENKKRISLGLKQLQPHPWDEAAKNIKEGDVVKGRVVNVEDYGAFLEVMPGVEGLIHISEVSWSNQQINAKDYFTVGQELDAKVVSIDREDRKMSLSIKQLTPDPWDTIEERFPVGSRHTVKVKNLTQYGVFVELEEGIGGMIHISDLSWTKRYSHPSEFTKVGEEIDAIVLEIDKENRKISLGHKQTEENPWDTFETVFPVGSYHEGTIVRRDDRGAIVQLPHGLEAFAPAKHLKKEDGSMAQVEDTLIFKVIEFNRDDKRLLVSHTRYLDDIRREADEQVKEEKQKEVKETRQAVRKTQATVERSTLGDLDALSQIKEQLQEQEAPAEEEKPKAKGKKKAAKKAEEPAAEEKAEDKADEAKAENTDATEAEDKADDKGE